MPHEQLHEIVSFALDNNHELLLAADGSSTGNALLVGRTTCSPIPNQLA